MAKIKDRVRHIGSTIVLLCIGVAIGMGMMTNLPATGGASHVWTKTEAAT